MVFLRAVLGVNANRIQDRVQKTCEHAVGSVLLAKVMMEVLSRRLHDVHTLAAQQSALRKIQGSWIDGVTVD